MRLKVNFDNKLKLGDRSRVVVALPRSIEYVRDLIEFLRDTFHLTEDSTGPLSVSIDEFLITSDQLVSDVLRNDDVIIIQPKRISLLPSSPFYEQSSPPCYASKRNLEDQPITILEEPALKIRKAEVMELLSKLEKDCDSGMQIAVSEGATGDSTATRCMEPPMTEHTHLNIESLPSAKEEPVPEHTSIELYPGDEIRFFIENADEATHGIVRNLAKGPGNEDTVVEFTSDSGSWASMRLAEMVDLSVVFRAIRGSDDDVDVRPNLKLEVLGEPPVKFEPDVADLKRVQSWRDKQRKRCISALRRQIEWIIKEEGSLALDNLVGRSRIKDLTDTESDVIAAITASQRLSLDQVSNTVKLVV